MPQQYKAEYCGPLHELRHPQKRGVLLQMGEVEGTVIVQFDGKEDWRNPEEHKLKHPVTKALLCVGWHLFDASDFNITEELGHTE